MPLSLKRSGTSQRFDFAVHVHTLAPFPPGYGHLTIEWERGTKRHGAMAPAPPTHLPGGGGGACQYRFDNGEPLHIPCTLRADPSSAVSHYGFAKKVLCLAIAVAPDPQHKGSKHLTRLGTAVLNLAECAGGDAEHTLLLPVACVSAVTSLVKQPYLEVTVQRKGSAARGSSEGPSSQQGSSHAGWTSRHSDTTGSAVDGAQSDASSALFMRRMAAQHHQRMSSGESAALASVRRPPITPVRRPGHPHASPPASVATPLAAFDPVALLDDDDDLPPSVSQAHSRQASMTGSLPKGWSGLSRDDPSALVPVLEGLQSKEEASYVAAAGKDTYTASTPRDDDFCIDPIRAVPGGSARKLPRAPPPAAAAQPHHRRTHTAPDIVLSGSPHEARAVEQTPPRGALPPMPAPPPPLGDLFLEPLLSLDSVAEFSDVDLRDGVAARNGADGTDGVDCVDCVDGGVRDVCDGQVLRVQCDDPALTLLAELRTAAALEAAVFLSRRRYRPDAPPTPTLLYAPARRIARTVMALGPTEGPAFAGAALAALKSEGGGCVQGCEPMAGGHWLVNVVQLRWMLWALQGELGGGWHAPLQALLPPLRELECALFGMLAEGLWQGAVLQGALDVDVDALYGGRVPTQGEVAAYRWQVGLQAAANALAPLQASPVAAHQQLRKQLLSALLTRMDDALVTVVLQDRRARTGSLLPAGSLAPAGSMSDPGRTSSLDPVQLRLPHPLLLFRGKVLTFGEGVALKMAITQWQQWASRQDLYEADSCCPRLRAAADLLMFPKDMLRDAATRAEILPALSLSQVCAILAKFVPDDYAPDSVPRGLVYDLHTQVPAGDVLFPDLRWRYQPVEESDLLERELVVHVSLDMGEESDEELDELERMFEVPGSEGLARFQLVRQLWESAR